MKNKTYLKIKRDRDGRWIAYSVPKTRPQVVIVGLIFIAYLICYMIYGYPAIAGTSIAFARTGNQGYESNNRMERRSGGIEKKGNQDGLTPFDRYSFSPCGLEAVECEGETIDTGRPDTGRDGIVRADEGNERGGVSSKHSKSPGIATSLSVAGFNLAAYATNPAHEQNVARIYASISVKDKYEADAFIKARFPKSPVTGGMVYRASEKYDVDPRLVMAIMQEDSGYGTRGLGARTFNPGNVANRDDGHTFTYSSWELGVEGVACWLSKHRTDAT